MKQNSDVPCWPFASTHSIREMTDTSKQTFTMVQAGCWELKMNVFISTFDYRCVEWELEWPHTDINLQRCLGHYVPLNIMFFCLIGLFLFVRQHNRAETFIINYCALRTLGWDIIFWCFLVSSLSDILHLALWWCSRVGERAVLCLSVLNSSCYLSIPSRGSQQELQTLGFTCIKKLSRLAKSHFSALFTGKAARVTGACLGDVLNFEIWKFWLFLVKPTV